MYPHNTKTKWIHISVQGAAIIIKAGVSSSTTSVPPRASSKDYVLELYQGLLEVVYGSRSVVEYLSSGFLNMRAKLLKTDNKMLTSITIVWIGRLKLQLQWRNSTI